MDTNKKIEWLLRVGVAGEFIGHGLLGVGKKADWIKWIGQLIGTSPALSKQLLLLIGCFDLIVALIVLIKPIRIVLLWAAVWGFWTALVRPLVGLEWWDFVERFANWGAPLALLFARGWPRSWRELWQ